MSATERLHGRVSWMKIELSLDTGTTRALYVVEGTPDPSPLRVTLEPEYAGSPVAVLAAIHIDVNAVLRDASMIISNEDATDDPPALVALT